MIRSITLYFLLFFALPVVALAAEKNTPLHYAAGGNACETAALLIDRGADVNATDKYGNTPLDIARESKNWNIVQLLE